MKKGLSCRRLRSGCINEKDGHGDETFLGYLEMMARPRNYRVGSNDFSIPNRPRDGSMLGYCREPDRLLSTPTPGIGTVESLLAGIE